MFARTNGRTRKGDRYDRRHQDARAEAARSHDPSHPCQRCGRALGPMGPHLHYDHDEHGGYLGFSHGRCNVRAGAIKGNRASRGLTTIAWHSRNW